MKLSPKRRLNGRLNLPGDKSISHRAAMIAALANGVSSLRNFSTSRDCASTLSCLEQLGATVTRKSNSIEISGQHSLQQPTERLDCGNSGSTMRILSGILASYDLTCELIGDESLSTRPMNRIIQPLQAMGATIDSQNGNPPLTIHGTSRLLPITYELPIASAQVKSAILFAGLRVTGRTSVIETSKSRDHTELLFNGFGVPVETTTNESSQLVICLDGPALFSPGDINIPGDISSGAYFIAAAMLLEGSDLTIERVGLNPTRIEFLKVLQACGSEISITDKTTERNEPVGTIHVRGGSFSRANGSQPIKLGGASIPSLIDELPLLAVVGSQIPGGLEITEASELRHKETDRLSATACNLRAMGAKVDEFDDGLRVSGSTQLRGTTIDSFGDHRIAMAFSVAALIADGPSEIHGSECVGISFPEFFNVLDRISES